MARVRRAGPGGRAALRRALGVIGAAVAIGMPSSWAVDDDTTTTIDRALTTVSSEGRPSLGDLPTTVALPDDWSVTRPGFSGGVWYRVAFRIKDGAGRDELQALYVERACSNLLVRLNGAPIFSGGRMQPMTRNCSRSQLVPLPGALLLRTQDNFVDILVQGYSLGHVAARQGAGGLSRIEVGPQATLAREHSMRLFWEQELLEASSLVLIGLGCVLVAVGWLNSREVYFSYLGWLCLAWVVRALAAGAREMPWSNDVTEFMLCSSWAVLLALAVQFLLSFAGLRSRTIENLMALQWVLMPLSLVLVGPAALFAVARGWYLLLAVELAFVIGIYFVTARRLRPQDLWPMGALVGAAGLALLRELGVQFGGFDYASVSAAQFVVPAVLAVMGGRLFLMFARALRATERDRNALASQLHRLTAEFDDRVEALTAQRVEQLTERERKRIASDLHDDLGAKLLTIVHTSDGARIPQLAREALEEMRLSVRGLAGKPVRLDDAFADWRAEIMVRLEQAKIEGSWEHPGDGIAHMLPARVFMQLTRVLREAVSNVIKHSAARHCSLRFSIDVDQTLRVSVKDDGRGISADLHRGQGMASMKRRAKKMNGQCLVESRPGYGVVISLTVPL